jgi:hypothetical protein
MKVCAFATVVPAASATATAIYETLLLMAYSIFHRNPGHTNRALLVKRTFVRCVPDKRNRKRSVFP